MDKKAKFPGSLIIDEEQDFPEAAILGPVETERKMGKKLYPHPKLHRPSVSRISVEENCVFSLFYLDVYVSLVLNSFRPHVRMYTGN